MNPPHIIEACARAAHEVNRAYCVAIDDPAVMAAAPWDMDSTTEEHRASMRKGVAGALAGNTPEQSHAGWMAEKLAAGWVYGPVKDAERKQHPCLVPYADLPEAQRKKDMLFIGTVHYPATPGYPAKTRNWTTGEETIEL